MGRAPRPTPGDVIYHCINRSNGRVALFRKDADYEAFERILEEAKEKYPVRVLAYVVMPNHWHLVLQPYNDGDLSKFLRWITLTHTQRWHAHYHNIGYGHLYQGRFKSFPAKEKVSGTFSSLYHVDRAHQCHSYLSLFLTFLFQIMFS